MSRPPMYDDDDYDLYTSDTNVTDDYYDFEEEYIDLSGIDEIEEDFKDFERQLIELEYSMKLAIEEGNTDLADRLEDEIKLLHLSLDEMEY